MKYTAVVSLCIMGANTWQKQHQKQAPPSQQQIADLTVQAFVSYMFYRDYLAVYISVKMPQSNPYWDLRVER